MALIKHDERYGPYMTANNAPAPYAATASQNSWGAFRAFSESLDDDISFTGLASGTEQWVQIKLDVPIRIWAFRIACRTTVSAKDAGQVPKNFVVQGSADGTVFEDIQAYTDMDWEQFTSWDATNNKYDWADAKKIEITSNKEYQYYRFLFGECQSVSTQKTGSMTPTSSNTVKPTLIDMYQVEGAESPEITVTGIRITHEPDKTRYEVGAELDATGLVVTADMSDGSAQTVTDYILSGYNGAATGQKTVTVAYQGHTATFVVIVYELSSIAITTLPAKVQYNVGEKLDLTGMVVTATYSDGVAEAVTDYTVSGYDGSAAGTCTVVVAYQGESVSFEVTVAQTTTGITLESLLNTTDKMMVVHDKFTSFNVEIDGPEWFFIDGTTALKIEIGSDASVRFNKDVSKRIELCAAGIGESISKIYTRYGFITGDDEFFKVRVEGSSAYYSSEIAPEKEIKYEMIFLKSGRLVINWIKAPETAPSYNLTILSYLKLANQQLMLPITGAEPVLFTIKRIDDAGTKWEMEIASDSVEELTGTLSGMDLISSTEQYNKKITVSGVSWFEFDDVIADTIYLDTNGHIGLGKNTPHIEVFYKTYAYFTNIFRQEGSLNNGKRFLKLRIHGYYRWQGDTNKKVELFLLEDGRIFYYVIESPTNSTYLGSSSFRYGDVRSSLNIPTGTVNKPIWFYLDNPNKLFAIKYGYESPITGMQVSKQPTKTVFYKGDDLKFDGMQVSLTYEDDSLAQISKCLVQYTDDIGQQQVTVTFGDYSTSFLADIIEDTVDSLRLSLDLDHFIVGQELHGVTVTATYKTGKTKTVTPEEYSIVEFDTSTTGEKNLRISYEGCEASSPIVVTENADFTLDMSEYAKLKYLVGIDDFYSGGVSGNIVFSDGYKKSLYSSEMEFSGFSNEATGILVMTARYGVFTAEFQIEISDTITEDIGAENIADVVAGLNVVSGILTVTGTGETKSFSHSRGDDLFGGEYSEYVKEIIIEEGITKLGNLFSYHHELTKVTLPSTLTHILYEYDGCFKYCDKLEEINIPESLTVINGFWGCTGLTNIELSENVTEIGDDCFYECPNLEVTIKNKYCAIYEYSVQVKLIKGYSGSTAEEYAFANEIPFESIDTIISISVYSVPYKATYFVLEKELNTSGLVIQGITDLGASVTVIAYSVGAVDFSTAGTKTVTVSYKDLTTTFDISVINPSFESICNSTIGMTDGTTASAPWFMYNGVAAESISCKNGALRFNGAADGVSVCASAYPYKSYYSYMLETILDNGIRVLKFRTHYLTKNSVAAHVEHEIFLFSTNDIYVNVIRMPDDGSTMGDIGNAVGKLVSNGKEYNFNFKKGEPAKRSCYHIDSTGLDWSIKAEEYVFPTSPIRAEITKLPDKIDYFIGDSLDTTGITVTLIFSDGTRDIAYEYTTEYDFSVSGLRDVKVIDKSGMSVTFQVYVNVKIDIGYPVDSDVIGMSDIRNKVLYINGNGATSDGSVLESDFPAPVRKSTEKVIISEGITRIGSCTFSLFSEIKEVIGIDKIQEIGSYAFYYNKKIYGTLRLDNIIKIGDNAFDTCEGIEHIEVKKPAKTIGKYAFSRMVSLKEIRIDKLKDTITGAPWGASNERIIWREPVTGIRISRYPDKVYYKLNDTLDTTGLEVVEIRADGKEYKLQDYSLSEFDSSTVGNKEISISYEKDEGDDISSIHFVHFTVRVTATGDNPFGSKGPMEITVHWPNGEFADLTNADLAGGTGAMELRESICSDNYFIFGGCVSNQLSFTTHSDQFLSTDESVYPHGDIEVYIECKGTRVKIFTGTIDSGKRNAGLTQREIIAYDYLYKFRNTDIAWWYKNKTVDKQMVLTQKQFRDELFRYLGIEQVPATLYYDNAYVPNTNISGELNAVRIIKDMCLQNNVFGWVNRDGRFEYLKLLENSRRKSHDNAGNVTYEYFPATVYVDNYESCDFVEGRIWYPTEFYSYPEPNYGFSSGPPNAQEAYERNVYYNRNSFFVGNYDWLDTAWLVNEYGVATVQDPVFPICFGPFADIFRLYRAQGYNVTVRGNPLNKVGDTIEITVRKIADDGTQLEWVIHSYIMSRTLKLLGDTSMYDTYNARNAPYNGNNTQAGTYTPELSAEMFRARAEGPVISYTDFDDGSSALAAGSEEKKVRFRCAKKMTKAGYEALYASGRTRKDTIYGVVKKG